MAAGPSLTGSRRRTWAKPTTTRPDPPKNGMAGRTWAKPTTTRPDLPKNGVGAGERAGVEWAQTQALVRRRTMRSATGGCVEKSFVT